MALKKFQIFLSLTCKKAKTKTRKLQTCTRIQSELAALGIRSARINTMGVADITALVEWEEAEIHDKLMKIRAIQGIESVEARKLLLSEFSL